VKPDAPLDEAKFRAARRRRSIALGLVLAAFALMFYVLTIVKMGPGLFDRAL
jgi:hypothetical protein